MNNPFYFLEGILNVGFKIHLDSHHINHANSKLTTTPNYPEFGVEVRFIKKIVEELSVIYTRLLNQNKLKFQTVLSARVEYNRILDEAELFINLNINHNLTQTDVDYIDVKSPLESQIQQQEMKDSGWRFDKISSMMIYSYKTGEMNG